MNLRWLIGNFTDPQYNLPFRQQLKLSGQAHDKHLPAGRFWAFLFLAILAPIALAIKFAIPVILQWLDYEKNTAAHTWAYLTSGFIAYIYSMWMFRILYIKPIRLAMKEQGYDLCINCGYELKGLTVDIDLCPECGTDRKSTD